MANDKIRVLIVDDSRIFRSALETSLKSESDLEIVDSVWSGSKAMEVVRAKPVDVVLLDLEMPGMNGLETLKAIEQFKRDNQREICVLMVSAFTKQGAAETIEALTAGALDFITKPSMNSAEESVQALRQQLLVKMRHGLKRFRKSGAVRALPATVVPQALPAAPNGGPRDVRAIVIAVSTGGPKALTEIMPDLCQRVAVPIFIVQHIPTGFTQSLVEVLSGKCSHRVIEANHLDVVEPKTVYFGHSDRHLVLKRSGADVLTSLNDQPKENGFRPSGDVLFRSAAQVYGRACIGIVLTGMMDDGTAGAGALKRAGAYVIAQDRATSSVWGMPKSAYDAGYVDALLPLLDIPAHVQSLILT